MENKILKNRHLFWKRIKLSIMSSVVFVFLLWIVFVVDHTQLLDYNFSRLGIYPLKVKGIIGIIFSPLVHASLSHIASNTFPLLILITLIFFFYNQIAVKSILLLWFLSGSFTWFIGRNAYHIGASGLIFALVFFLFFSGIFRRYERLSAVSMIVVFIYGSTIWSIFPIAELVDVKLSWESHLSGAVAGLITAFVYRKEGPQKPDVVWEDDESYNDDVDDETENNFTTFVNQNIIINDE